MEWEHRPCGVIVEGARPPDRCEFCASRLVSVKHDREQGWLRVGPEDRPKRKRARRSAISKAKRERVYARDGYRCVECGFDDELTLDHKVPISKGGRNDDDNLQTMCRDCNRRKADYC